MTARQFTLCLTDESDAIEIAEDGEPQPTKELRAWLDGKCLAAWRHEVDSVLNVFFHFENADDAARFKARWNATEP